jgi:hypothetical protein
MRANVAIDYHRGARRVSIKRPHISANAPMRTICGGRSAGDAEKEQPLDLEDDVSREFKWQQRCGYEASHWRHRPDVSRSKRFNGDRLAGSSDELHFVRLRIRVDVDDRTHITRAKAMRP